MTKKIFCPNCGATMETSTDGYSFICNYCDTTLANNRPISTETQSNGSTSDYSSEEKLAPAQKLFNLDDFFLANEQERIYVAFSQMCAWINSNYTLEKYMDFINKLAGNSSDILTAAVNTNGFNVAKAKASKQFEAGEKALLFLNQGIISKGKDGFLITDRAIYQITKKKGDTRISYKDFHSLEVYESEIFQILPLYWYINGNKDLSLYCTGCNDAQIGIILGMICTLSRDCNTEGYQITLLRK